MDKLMAACADPENVAARNLLSYTRANGVTGVAARMLLASRQERDFILTLIRIAITEHDRRLAA
jgi:hypothetical protein